MQIALYLFSPIFFTLQFFNVSQQWMLKNAKGFPFFARLGFFVSLILFFVSLTLSFFYTFMSFCYFWALDMAPTYAVPGLLKQIVSITSTPLGVNSVLYGEVEYVELEIKSVGKGGKSEVINRFISWAINWLTTTTLLAIIVMNLLVAFTMQDVKGKHHQIENHLVTGSLSKGLDQNAIGLKSTKTKMLPMITTEIEHFLEIPG